MPVIIGIDPAYKNVGLAYLNTHTGGFAVDLVDWSGGVPFKDFDPFKSLESWLLYFYTPYQEWLNKADAIVIERPYHSKNQPLTAMLSAFVHYLCAYCIGKVHLVEPGAISKYFKLSRAKNPKAPKLTTEARYAAKKKTCVERALSLLWSSHPYCFVNQFVHQSLLTVKKKDDMCDAVLIAYYYWAYNSGNGPALQALAHEEVWDQWVWNLYITTPIGQEVLRLGTQALPYTLTGHMDQVTISKKDG